MKVNRHSLRPSRIGDYTALRTIQPAELTNTHKDVLEMTTSKSQAKLPSNRFKRSQELLQVIQKIDLYTDLKRFEESINWINQQYPHETSLPIGFFSRCYLGAPFIDHKLSLTNHILEHYARGDVVPDPYVRARALAANPAYRTIEVYSTGQIVPIYADGSAAATINPSA